MTDPVFITIAVSLKDNQLIFAAVGEDGRPMFDIAASLDQVGSLVKRGGTGTLAVSYMQHTPGETPMRRETQRLEVEAPMLPDDPLLRVDAIHAALRPYEVEGWRGNRSQLGQPQRVSRRIGDRVWYNIDFERLVPIR